MAGRPKGSPNKGKPFRDALRMELAAMGGDQKALRAIAQELIDKAILCRTKAQWPQPGGHPRGVRIAGR